MLFAFFCVTLPAKYETNMIFRYLLLAFSLFFLPVALWAQEADFSAIEVNEQTLEEGAIPADSAVVFDEEKFEEVVCGPCCSATKFNPYELIFPSVAVALGGAGVKNHLLSVGEEREAKTFDNPVQYLPLVGYAGLGFIPGLKHEHNFGDRLMIGATAFVIMTAICQSTKRLVKEPRPDTGAKSSFPSGHTATAFTGAELVRLEYGWGCGSVAYAFATCVGLMRIHNRRHWYNDVLAGAGVGVFSAEAAYWLFPYEKRLVNKVFHAKKKKNGVAANPSNSLFLAPTYSLDEKAPGLSFSMSF